MKCQGCTKQGNNNGLFICETERSIGEKINEHLTNFEAGEKTSIPHKHVEEKHCGKIQNILLKMISSCVNDAMLRPVTEAIFIKELNPKLNSKEKLANSNALRDKGIKFDLTNLSMLNSSTLEERKNVTQFLLNRLQKF